MRYHIGATNGVNPIEAGFGLVHADTIVATTSDTLTITPAAKIQLTVKNRVTRNSIAELGLPPGNYTADLHVAGKFGIVDKKVQLLLVDPNCVCRRFGARYGSLEYPLPVITGKGRTAAWDSLWKSGAFADIIVDFPGNYKFILWRGMSYAPSWAMNNIITSLFFAETIEPGEFRDCCEMMSDRECAGTATPELSTAVRRGWSSTGRLPAATAPPPLTDPADYLDRPTHTFLGYAINAPVDVRENGAVTWSWFCGVAPEDDRLLRNRARSWLTPSGRGCI